VHDAPVEDGAAGGAPAMGAVREDATDRGVALRRVVVGRQERHGLAVEAHERALLRLAETPAARDDGAEHRGDVRGRAADHAEDLARGRLLVQRLREIAVAGLELLEQPDVLDRDDRLVGEGLHERDLLVGEGSDLELEDREDAHEGLPLEHRNAEHRPDRVHLRRHVGVLRIRPYVGDVHRPPLEGGPRGAAVPPGGDRIPLDRVHELRRRVVPRGRPEELTVEAEDERPLGVAQPDGVLGQRVEHGLQVERRAADDLEHLARRGLLLQGLGEVGVLGLQLAEEARVLDGDRGLVGERGDEVDLLAGERADLRPPHEQHTDQHVLPEHRDGQRGPVATDLPRLVQLELGIGEDVGEVHHPVLEGGPPDHGAPAGADHVPPPVLGVLGAGPVLRDEAEHRAVEPGDQRPLGPGQAGGVLDESLEHGLEVEGRAADRLEHFAGRRLLLQALGEVAVANLALLQQAGIVDGDHRLVGEALEELDPPVGERRRLASEYHDRPDGVAVPQHRHRQGAPEAGRARRLHQAVLGMARHVGDVNRAEREDGAGADHVPAGRRRKRATQGVRELGTGLDVGRQVKKRPVERQDPSVQAIAEPHRPLGDHVEHGLRVGGRARDDA
jgi:hypothetical protein